VQSALGDEEDLRHELELGNCRRPVITGAGLPPEANISLRGAISSCRGTFKGQFP